jgi:Holliday junction resolvase
MSNDTEAITVFPDIIVHKRGTDENLLVIEMKKTTSKKTDTTYDLGKLNAFKSQLGYQFAIFIKLQTDGKAGIDEIQWV